MSTIVLLLVVVNIAFSAASSNIIFEADFTQPTLSAAFGGVEVKYGDNNVVLWSSGRGIDVTYPEGSRNPSNSPVGGFGLYTNTPVTNGTAILSYSVYFPVGFNFVLGKNVIHLLFIYLPCFPVYNTRIIQ